MPVVGARHQSSRIKSDLHIKSSHQIRDFLSEDPNIRGLPSTAWLLADNVADTNATPQVSANDISVSVLQPPIHSFHHDVSQQILTHQKMQHFDFSIFSVFRNCFSHVFFPVIVLRIPVTVPICAFQAGRSESLAADRLYIDWMDGCNTGHIDPKNRMN